MFDGSIPDGRAVDVMVSPPRLPCRRALRWRVLPST